MLRYCKGLQYFPLHYDIICLSYHAASDRKTGPPFTTSLFLLSVDKFNTEHSGIYENNRILIQIIPGLLEPEPPGAGDVKNGQLRQP